MYSTCIFCNSRLGANEVVEEFPVGRRLAFDPDKGRLWALCPKCRQWNLSPIEERWEALESLERVYRDTPQRYSTDQIGLAKHREGLEVVRIGQPTRPEYAAWRYGGELMRRRRRTLAAGHSGRRGGRWRASWISWSGNGGRRRKSPPSPTTCSCPSGFDG